MRLNSLLVVICLLFLLSCDEKDPVTPDTPIEEEVKKELTQSLANESDLTEFIAVFEELELEAQDVEQGLTIFAPADADNSGGRLSESPAPAGGLTPEVLKGHIVKTLLSAANLDDGDTLIALDGRLLVVKIDGDEIRVNGVLITSKDVASADKYVVHKVAEILGEPVEPGEPIEPATLTVVVKNSLTWTPQNPDLDTEAGAIVSLYATHADYAAGNAAKTTETNGEGKAVFSDLKAGDTYYVLVQKGEMSNLYYRTTELVDGMYLAFAADGVFQSQEEVDTHGQQGAAVGNVKFKDMNSDGIITNDDKVAAPHLGANLVSGENEVEVIIGYNNNDPMIVNDGLDALKTLQSARNSVNIFHKALVQADGILSDDAECGTEPAWCILDNFDFDPNTPVFMQIWSPAYAAIGNLNLLLRDVPALDFFEKPEVLGEAKALRAYIYLELAAYFGDIPVQEGLALSNEARTPKDEVLTLVKNDLQSAADLLPNAPSSASAISSFGAKALLARLALLQQDWETAATLASGIIESANYSLMGSTEAVFADASNNEIMWNLSTSVPAGFQAYFFNRSFCPVVRLGEVYLIAAEAQNELGVPEAARNYMNAIRSRANMATSSADTQAAIRTDLRETWKTDMSREGNRFSNLLRWGLAYEYLEVKGFNPNIHPTLPIPQAFLDNHPNLVQNPGY